MKKLSELELALKKIATVVQDRLSTKQNVLTAGTGITIALDGTISATGTTDLSNYVLKSDTVGLLKNDGTVNTSSYAGGTAVTLNGTSKAGNVASFYAPTSAGTSGYVLKSNGSGAPSWSTILNAGVLPKLTLSSVTATNVPSTLVMNTYYRITSNVGSKTFTLPAPSDTSNVGTIVLYFTTSSTPAVTISSSKTIKYFSGYTISGSKTYELNCMWNGSIWVVGYASIT